MDPLISSLVLLAAIAAGVGMDRLLVSRRDRRRVDSALERSRQTLADAEREAENRLKEATLESQEKIHAAEQRIEAENQAKHGDFEVREQRLRQGEKNLQRRVTFLDQRQTEVEHRETEVQAAEQKAGEIRSSLDQLATEQRERLEKIAGLSAEAARQELVREMESDAKREAASLLRKIEEQTKQNAHQEAVRITTRAISRVPFSQIVDSTLTIIELPDDEMKGRIIGRDGRNIRSLEMTTGVDLIVDDTPNAILLSAFDPLRREIAHLAIRRLLADGRIHPARIEETVTKVRNDMETWITEAGEAAAFEFDLHDLHPKLIRLVGRMKYHLSHSVNILQHCREVAVMAGHMAAQLDTKVETAKRAGLLHEIGQVEEQNPYSSPILLSAELAQRYNENEGVVHAIQALHRDVAPKTVEAVLLQCAERIALARPGARKDNLDIYIQRLTNLEQIARSFSGVREAFAVKAGREMRVIVDTEKVTDEQAVWLSRDIASRIEHELNYPGQIKVSVVRETRFVSYAM
ncbi:MAG: ribonuclease Y [Acidobacteriota bacterium]